jgi:hypothetical protein
MVRLRIVYALGLVVFSACSPSSQNEVLPTQALVEPRTTDTPVPQTPTITFTPLPPLEDLLSPTPAVSSTPLDITPESQLDPIAAELVALAQRRVAQELNLPVRRVSLLSVKPYIWPDTSLGCPLPDETYTTSEVDGYRIVLTVDNKEYIFHTDFDRAIPCEAQNEQLPATDDN